jgi:hypothetical protein
VKSFGAQYVVYEDSGFLAESVLRIYPLVQKILFLVGLEPWNGKGDRRFPKETLATIMSMDDPDHKFIVVSKKWGTEHEERNEGLRILHDHRCDWCLLVDDDEMYNRSELWNTMGLISQAWYANGRPSAYVVKQLIYWKDRETVIDGLTGAMPHFFSTNPGDVAFVNAKNFQIMGGVFSDISEEALVCHHLSYVRTEEQMRRRFSWFSHANEVKEEWIDRVWLKWTPEMEDLHPQNPGSFKRAIKVADTPWRLENLPGPLRKKLRPYPPIPT